MGLSAIPGIGADGSVTATTTPQKIANSLAVQRVVTISSLKDVAGTVDGETVLCEGYYTKGDCEPLSYYWDADSVLADNGVDSTHPGLIVQPTGVSGAGRWVARRPNYLNVKWFGAKGDNVQNDTPYIQKACNVAIYDANLWPQVVFFPATTYRLESGILLKRDENGDKEPEGFSLELLGESGFPYGIESYSLLNCIHTDTFCFGIQLGKGIRIRKLYMQGQNSVTFANPYLAYTSSESSYVINGCRDNQYSPYSAIAIDPFGRTGTVIEANRYPGYSAEYTAGHTNGGTTDVKIEDCRIHGWVCGVVLSPNGYTQNAEQIEIKRTRFGSCKVGIAPCQLQSRSVRVEDFTAWGDILYFVNCSLYGAGSGQLPHITGGNMAGNMKYMFFSNATVSTSYIDGLFAESLYAIGRISTDVVSFNGFIFKFALPTSTEAVAQTILSSSKQINFFGCELINSANAPNGRPLGFEVANLRLYGCTLDVPVQNLSPYVDDVHYDNCIFRHITGPVETKNYGYSSGGRIISNNYVGKNGTPIAPGQEIMFQAQDAASVRNYGRVCRNAAFTQRIEHVEGVNVTLTVNDANQTATFTSAVPIRWNIATRSTCPVVIPTFKTNEFGVNCFPCGYVSNVTGSVVTISGLPIGFASGSYQINTVLPYRYHEPCIGTTTNGSNVITDVRCFSAVTSVWRVGEMISGAGIPVGTYVTARDNTAKTIILSQNATATATGVDLFDAPIITRAFANAQPTLQGWTKGDLIDDSTGATNGWRCTSSGTFGSSTDPVFAAR